jgi:uncharacterized RDD family membrane protein YckC
MTQPPDDRPRPDQPSGEGAPENEPTVAWTPPENEPDKPAGEGGTGYAAMPDEGTAPPPPAEPTAPEPPAAEPPAAEPPPPAPQEAAAASPIISAEPTQPTSSWETPAQTTGQVPPPAAPATGWAVPAAAAAAPQQEGYVIAGVGARIVAWLVDATLATIVPIILTLALIDYSAIIQDAIRQAELDPSGRLNTTAMYTIPVTLDYVLVTLIGLGILFLYFVGFWTSRWRATPGMIGLKMRVVDATTGGTISITQAAKRWVALGFPLALLGLIPALQSAAGIIQFAVVLFVFFTVVTNDRRQGLHDRWANSLVIRHGSSGNGATFAGCLVWGVLIILIAFIASTIFLAAAMPSIQEYIESLPSNAA